MEEHAVDYVSYLLRMWQTSQDNPWRAQCDEVYGIPAPETTLQWGWGFMGYPPE